MASSGSSSASRTSRCVMSQAIVADALGAQRIGRDAADLDVDRLAGFAGAEQRGRAVPARARPRGCAGSNQAAMPAIRPPPPTLTSTDPGTAALLFDLAASVPAPATTSGWS
jgi:hypothetical protein